MVSIFYILSIFGVAISLLPVGNLASPAGGPGGDFESTRNRWLSRAILKRQKTTCTKLTPRFVGCYNRDNRKILGGRVDYSETMTQQDCKNRCFEEFTFAAVDGEWCFCGNQFTAYPSEKLDDSDCLLQCPGEASQMCGGNGKTRIWLCSDDKDLPTIDTGSEAPPPSPESPAFQAPSTTEPPDAPPATQTPIESPSSDMTNIQPVTITDVQTVFLSNDVTSAQSSDPETTTVPANIITAQEDCPTVTSTVLYISRETTTAIETVTATRTIMQITTTTSIQATTTTSIQIATTTSVETITTTIVPASAQASGTTSFGCPAYGFVANETGIFFFDLNTSALLKIDISTSIAYPDALAYNVLDHSLYFIEQATSSVMKLTADGNVTTIFSWPPFSRVEFGDIDTAGQYWIATAFDGSGISNWTRIDLNPYSPKYGNIVTAGQATRPGSNTGGRATDWTFIPSAGRFLWSFGVSDPNSNEVCLWKFDMDNPGWSCTRSFGKPVNSTINACFGVDTGDLFCTVESGEMFVANVHSIGTSGAAGYPNAGPGWIRNGARCVLNTAEIPNRKLTDLIS
ncbi:hypothetical protein TWF281_005763 [Arthrobotrys megalospora]